jgi:hypothetical protein
VVYEVEARQSKRAAQARESEPFGEAQPLDTSKRQSRTDKARFLVNIESLFQSHPFVFYQARRVLVHHLKARQYKVINLNQRIVNEAFRLTFERSLRAYDAVQLAMASFDKSRFVFITADSSLESAARAEGLQTDNPLGH